MHPASPPFLAQLMRSQWRDRERLERLQRVRLTRLLRHAYRRVPYYRQLFETAGITPDDIRSVADLPRIPITTKDVLQAEPAPRVIASGIDPDKCITRQTSGSTGHAFSFLITRRQKEAQDMVQARALLENGLKLTDRRAVFVAPWEVPRRATWFQQLGFWRKHYFSVFEDVREHLHALERIAPESIAATPAVLARIAEESLDRGITLRPRTVFSSGDLLDRGTRVLIESAFGVAPVDLYGSLEFGYLAWECSLRNGYHINLESAVIEIVDADRIDGDAGEVVCTNLLAYTMPLIRFRLGDLCRFAKEPCPCGRSLPLLDLVAGRTNDVIRLPDGRCIAPQALADRMARFSDELRRFRIVQEEIDRVEVLIVPRPGAAHAAENVASGLRAMLGEQISINVRGVTEISAEESGKQRTIVSKLGATGGGAG